MKKNIIFLIGGIVTGFALCLTTAMLIPLDNELDAFEGRIGPRGMRGSPCPSEPSRLP